MQASTSVGVTGPFLTGLRQDMTSVLFSLKCLLAAVVAYYIALRIGLSNPYWSITTTYIVSGPLTGAVLSKAIARVIGTVIGAVATIALVPNLVDEPVALSAALAAWLGLCTYFAVLDRTPRSYIFVLAGYTASIIGFPAVTQPGAMFDIASTRVQEICIGIVCGSLVHALILPTTVTRRIFAATDDVVAAAIAWSRDGLGRRGGDPRHRERLKLAVDLGTLETLSTHLPFDTAPFTPRLRSLQALQSALIMVLPLVNTIEHRVQAIVASLGSVPDALDRLLARSRQAIVDQRPNDGDLLGDIRQHASRLRRPFLDWPEMLELNLLTRLEELLEVHCDVQVLIAHIRRPFAHPEDPRIHSLLIEARGRCLHRDYRLAIRAAVGSMIAVGLGCTFWIATAWTDGANAVLFIGICCSLFGNVETPVPNVRRFLLGMSSGIAISGVYAYALIPLATDFVPFVALLAPVLLLLGSVFSRPSHAITALGCTLGFCNTVGLSAHYTDDFAAYANGSLGIVVGVGFSVIAVRLFQTEKVSSSVRRIMHAIWRDVARRARGRSSDSSRYMSRMLDRIALLLPRADAASLSDEGLINALIAMRIGFVAGELQSHCAAESNRSSYVHAVREALAALARHFQRLEGSEPGAAEGPLKRDIMSALTISNSILDEGAVDAVIMLTSLYCNLTIDTGGDIENIDPISRDFGQTSV